MAEPEQCFKIIVRALPSPVPGVVRLRHALKIRLRTYGLRCLSVEELPAQPPPVATVATTGARQGNDLTAAGKPG
jgi:hypothetical protein